MGAGFYGGFGATKGAYDRKLKEKKQLFRKVKYIGSVMVKGIERDVSRTVYQRGDIDINYVDPKSGRNNLQQMILGNAPIGNDGKPIELHHILQKESGPMVEIRETTHKEYHKTLHGLCGNGESFRNNPELEKQYKNFKKAYWKWRAEQIIQGGLK